MPNTMRACAALVLTVSSIVTLSCDDRDKPSSAAKAQAKRTRDAALLALPYPRSTGVQPATMQFSYDGASDRTIMTLRLTGLRVSAGPAQNVSTATLYLTSSHRGRVRSADDPEGSVDGRVVVQTSSPGILAYSGPPGAVIADGRTLPLKEASGQEGYSSTKTRSGREEMVRFKFPTEDLVAAAAAATVAMSFGTLRFDVSASNLADLREFTARLNPRP